MAEIVYCLDTSVRPQKHWLGQANGRSGGCPTCLRASAWREFRGFNNTSYNSHRFPEEIRYMTSTVYDHKKTNCKRCGHPWIDHSRDCEGPCRYRIDNRFDPCKCSHFVKQDEEVTPEVPSTNQQGEQNMTPYEYLVLLDDKENQKSTVLVEPTLVLANSEEQVKLLAHRAVPEANLDDLNSIRVIIRRWSGSSY